MTKYNKYYNNHHIMIKQDNGLLFHFIIDNVQSIFQNFLIIKQNNWLIIKNRRNR